VQPAVAHPASCWFLGPSDVTWIELQMHSQQIQVISSSSCLLCQRCSLSDSVCLLCSFCCVYVHRIRMYVRLHQQQQRLHTAL
jgi:hypothetical protein